MAEPVGGEWLEVLWRRYIQMAVQNGLDLMIEKSDSQNDFCGDNVSLFVYQSIGSNIFTPR